MKTPVATFLSETPNQTKWRIQYPSTIKTQGRVYYATTYPDGDSVFIETAAKSRPVSKALGSKMHAEVRAAIDKVAACRGK